MYSDELKELCNHTDDKKFMISLGCSKSKKQPILDATSWMQEDAPLKIRCIAIQNNFNKENFPKCPSCQKPVGWDKSYNNKFLQFCSNKCATTFSSLPKEINDKNWLYQKRVVERISYKNIGTLLGCSEVPVRAKCKEFNIPSFNLTNSESTIQRFLDDKEWLIDQHQIKRKTVRDIASEIGTSPATISVWLNKHNIKTNTSNSYDRINNYVSNECQDVVDYISSMNVDIKLNDRQILNGREIDILIESHKLGIEYNGVFSHYYRPEETTYSKIKDKTYHLSKTNIAKNKGYDIFHIFSDDWMLRKDIVKSILSSKLGKTSKIFARKCTVEKISKAEKIIFLNENHIQGKDTSSIEYGLKYNDELVAVMTFCKSRFNKNYEWELSRFASKKFTTVVGGFSKLLKQFRKEYDGSIGSYADLSRSNGDVYEKNGFDCIKINKPSYYYVNLSKSIQRLHRAGFMKKKIAPNDPRSEEEVMLSLGYHKIFDCGTKLFIMK